MYYNQIRRIRKQKEMTIQQLADLAGISAGYICHLEKGTRKNPSIEVMEKIANALDETITEIFFN